MKKIFCILLVMVFLASCKKDSGTVIYKINFNTAAPTRSAELDTDILYTQFGDYITSLTPSVFIANIWTVGYVDKVFGLSDNDAQMLQYIEQNTDKLPPDDPSRIVNFSNNSTITFNPVLYGRVNNDGQFEDQQIDFQYFYFMPLYFYQEVLLPAEYDSVQLNMFSSGAIVNNILKVRHIEMFNKIFPNANTSQGFNFFFGNADSTFVVNPNGETVPTSDNNPISDATQNLVVRSNKYTNMVYNAPLSGETVVMNGFLSFDTGNLIQLYAGADNIPYTSDDIIVYAPKFWERIYSRLEIN